MLRLSDFFHRQVTVLGAGISNLPLIDFLTRHGAYVTVRDQKPPEAFAALTARWDAAGIRYFLGKSYLSDLRADYLFRSPGLRPDRPEILRAQAQGAVLTSEMELFFDLCPCPIFGVTGSDGKTTTTTLLTRLLTAAGKRVYLGGNIGAPLLPQVGQMTPTDLAVVELSSFQLMTMRRSPQIAVVTNLSENHLDYHRTFAEYALAKRNILSHTPCQTAVLNADDARVMQMAQAVPRGARVKTFSLQDTSADVYLIGDKMYNHGNEILDFSKEFHLPGVHNRQNCMAAYCACAELVTPQNVRRAVCDFTGVEHRLEVVATVDGVRYINSSIDSTPTRTAAALTALSDASGKLVVLLGGYDKQLSFAPLCKPLAENAAAVILFGATEERIAQTLASDAAFCAKQIPVYRCQNLVAAMEKARAVAQSGQTVLLSPACASFDAFANFEARGRKFKETVQAWKS